METEIVLLRLVNHPGIWNTEGIENGWEKKMEESREERGDSMGGKSKWPLESTHTHSRFDSSL